LRLTRHTAAFPRLLRCALVLSEVLLALLIARPASLSAGSPQSSITPSSATPQAPQSEVASWAILPLPSRAPTPSPSPTATPTPEPPPTQQPPARTAAPTVVPRVPAPTDTPPPAPASAVLPTSAGACGQSLIPLINQVRAENGLLPLVENPLLDAAAQRYAEFIASRSILSHTADGRTLDARALAAGYSGWSALGENLAGGYDTPEEVVAAWLASPGHRAIILTPSYTETGVGCAWNDASPYGSFWVQEFGAR